MDNSPARCPGISRDTEEHAVFRPPGFPWLNFRLLLKETACQSPTRAGLRAMAPRASVGGMEGESSGFGFTPHHTAVATCSFAAWKQLHDSAWRLPPCVNWGIVLHDACLCVLPAAPRASEEDKDLRCDPNLSIGMRAACDAGVPPATNLV